ncbi:Dihydrodipicolinate synthase [Tilletia horrida]|nr:Dihydrodipicolinate synthase [Tilletia horrida]
MAAPAGTASSPLGLGLGLGAFEQILANILTNPLNLVLLGLILYCLHPHFFPPSLASLTPTLAKARGLPPHGPPLSSAKPGGGGAGTSSAQQQQDNGPLLYSHLPRAHPETVVWTRFTPRTLAVHDGSGGSKSKILLAINGRVFDVSKGRNFYGPDGPYGNFAGRDASRGMAKQSFDLEMLTPLDQPLDKLDDLTPAELNNMREWIGHFSAKYAQVGVLVEEGEE